MIDDEQAGARPESVGDCIDVVGARRAGLRKIDRAHGAADVAGDIFRGVDDSAVAEVRHGDLVTTVEREGTQHGIGSRRDVVDEQQIVGFHADERGDGGGCHPHA